MTIVVVLISLMQTYRNSPVQVFSGKGVLKIGSKFTGEHPCRSVVSIKILCITLRQLCFPVNLLHIFRKPCSKNTYGGLLLEFSSVNLNFHPLIYLRLMYASFRNHSVNLFCKSQKLSQRFFKIGILINCNYFTGKHLF